MTGDSAGNSAIAAGHGPRPVTVSLIESLGKLLMKILVTGGRNYTNSTHVFTVLDKLHQETPISCVVHGAARGVDTLASRWASSRCVRISLHPADWTNNGRAAGFIRNQIMLLDEQPDLVVVFPGGRGTAHMQGLARAQGFKILKA